MLLRLENMFLYKTKGVESRIKKFNLYVLMQHYWMVLGPIDNVEDSIIDDQVWASSELKK